MEDGTADNDGSARYYATKSEQQLLVWGLRQYFSFPERSSNRSQIASQVTAFLKNNSPHWTHRAVRLWFNNNKKTFFSDAQAAMYQQMQIPLQQKQMQQSFQPHQQMPQQNVQNPLPQQTFMTKEQNLLIHQQRPQNPQIIAQQQHASTNKPPKMLQNQLSAQLALMPKQNPSILPQNSPQQVKAAVFPPPLPPQHPPQPVQMHATHNYQPQNITNPSFLVNQNQVPSQTQPQKQKQNPNQTISQNVQVIPPSPVHIQKSPQSPTTNTENQNRTQFLLPPIHPPPPKVRFDAVPMQLTVKQIPAKPPSSYMLINSVAKQIIGLKDAAGKREQFNKLRNEYDNHSKAIISSDGICNVDRIDLGTPYIRIRMMQDSGDDLLPDTPSDFSVPSKSLSFLDSSDTFLRPSTPDLFPVKAVWQDRRYTEQKVEAYDKVCIVNDTAAYVYNDLLTSEKIISFTNLNEENASWTKLSVPTMTPIDGLVISEDYAWCTSDEKVFCTNLHNSEQQIAFPFQRQKANGMPFLTCYSNDTALIGFSHSNTLFLSGQELKELPKSPYNGFTSLYSFQGNILCAPNDSFSIRQLSIDGNETNSYVGHCNFVREIIRRDENTFISRSDDNTVRLWDVRTSLPEIQILCGASAMCHDGPFIVLGMANKGLAIIDIRESKTKLCVSTQDYNAEVIAYSQQRDELIMFGMIARDVVKDSIMFIDNDGQSRKRVFRKYHNFVSIG